MRKLENTKGITLIALVITIIVLIILAGVSIAMLSGDNSILGRATDAKEKTGTKNLKEEVQLVIQSRITEKTTTGRNENTIKSDLENGISNATIEDIEGLSDAWYVRKDGAYITVYEDGDIQEGKAEIWDGSEISCPEFKKDENDVWNWYISKPSELKFLADFTNNGNSLTGTVDLTGIVQEAGYNTEDISIRYLETKVYLMNNLDIGARQVESNTIEGKWETEYNIAHKWTPIGTDFSGKNPPNATDKSFIGIFEGNNFCIRGLYINESGTTNGYAGLFGGYTSCVRNLTIKNSYIKGKTIAAGIACLAGGSGFKNCKNIDSVVIATSGTAAGIAGASWRSLENCINESTIIGINFVGGIVGQINSNSTRIKDCKNKGSVEGKKYVGGIIGDIYIQQSQIIGCINEGKIKATEAIGGIVGGSDSISDPILTECNNYGEVEGFGTGKYVGGIIGHIKSKATLNKCINKGLISGKQDINGIVGKYESNETVLNECIDNGNVRIIE